MLHDDDRGDIHFGRPHDGYAYHRLPFVYDECADHHGRHPDLNDSPWWVRIWIWWLRYWSGRGGHR